MVTLNGIEFAYCRGLSLKELMDDYNAGHPHIAFDGHVVLINGTVITASEARKKTLLDNDKIRIIELLEGG